MNDLPFYVLGALAIGLTTEFVLKKYTQTRQEETIRIACVTTAVVLLAVTYMKLL